MNSRHSFVWDEAAVTRLKTLVEQDATASEIAAHFGEGLTRSAVIGKCARLEITLGKDRQTVTSAERIERARAARRALPPRPVVERAEPKPRGQRRMPTVSSLVMLRPAPADVAAAAAVANLNAPSRRKAFDPAFAPEGARIVPLHALEPGECKWPLYEDGPMLFCGCRVTTFDRHGQRDSYCTAHLALRDARVVQ